MSEIKSNPHEGQDARADATANEWPLWEVFVRSKAGLDHKHCGSLHAADAKMAIQLARDVYTRRQEGSSVWVVRSRPDRRQRPRRQGHVLRPDGRQGVPPPDLLRAARRSRPHVMSRAMHPIDPSRAAPRVQYLLRLADTA